MQFMLFAFNAWYVILVLPHAEMIDYLMGWRPIVPVFILPISVGVAVYFTIKSFQEQPK